MQKTQNGLTLIDSSDNKLSLDGFLIQLETTLLYPEGDRPDDNIKFNETSVFTAILESITKHKKHTCEPASDLKYNYF